MKKSVIGVLAFISVALLGGVLFLVKKSVKDEKEGVPK